MFPTITDEMRRALALNSGGPIEVVDSETQKIYILSDSPAPRDSFDSWLRREIKIGIDSVARGEVSLWNVDEILAAGRKRLNAANQAG